jgi:hypothetical protein
MGALNMAGDLIVAVLLAITTGLLIDKLRKRKRKKLRLSIDIEE